MLIEHVPGAQRRAPVSLCIRGGAGGDDHACPWGPWPCSVTDLRCSIPWALLVGGLSCGHSAETAADVGVAGRRLPVLLPLAESGGPETG